jgi:hypothetical protein
VRFLSKSAQKDILLALLVMQAGGIRIIHNFTTDPEVLVAAVRKLQSPPTSRDAPALNTFGEAVDAEAMQIQAIVAGQAAAAGLDNPNTAMAHAKAAMRGGEALTFPSSLLWRCDSAQMRDCASAGHGRTAHLSMLVAHGGHTDLPGYVAPTVRLMPVGSTSQCSVQVLGFQITACSPHCAASIRFLFVGPAPCLQLPSDSTSRWTPLLFS